MRLLQKRLASRDVRAKYEPDALAKAALSACSIEIVAHAAILLGVVLPVFAIASPLAMIQMTLWAGNSSVVRIAAATVGAHLPSSAQLLFENKIPLATYVLGGFVTVVGFVAYRRQVKKRTTAAISLARNVSHGRRYREIPAASRKQVQEGIDLLWRRLETGSPPPPLYCFASTKVLACTLANGGLPAIALSTALIERIKELPRESDPLVRIVLLHEMAHILHGDQIRLPQAESIVAVCRKIVVTLGVAVGVAMTIFTIVEKLNVGGIEKSDSSLAAYGMEILGALSFAYLALIVIKRYASLLMMLVELRADVTAASTGGSVATFVSAVEQDGSVRHESIRERLRTLFGMAVSHLTSGERVRILRSRDRLLTPKLRYFSYSLLLPLVLLVDGFVAFTPYQWIIRAGILGVMVALNVACVLMVANAGSIRPKALSLRRLIVLSSVLVLANLLFFLDFYAVMMRGGELTTAALDPNFAEPLPRVALRAVALANALVQPYTSGVQSGRLFFWIGCGLISLWLLIRTGTTSRDTTRFTILGLAVVLGTVASFLVSPHAPNSLLKEWLQGKSWATMTVTWIGPIVGILLASLAAGFSLAHGEKS
jgi:Zn-dependent protease with chaperone function